MTKHTDTPAVGHSEVEADLNADGTQRSLTTKDMRRILASSFMGSMIEFYDFMLYATASSIVFAHLYFSGLGPALSVFASFTTLAVGYLARPLGGVIFGHFGDRVGRKAAMVTSMLIMGGVTVLIGVMPSTAAIGVTAPIGLLVLRILQGIAVGGEWGGGALMALEHAPKKKRGFAASFANAGGPAGAVLATLILSLMTVVTGENFLTWGWRIPFLFSAVLIVVGLVIRLKVSETPVFREMQEKEGERKAPILVVLRHHLLPVLVGLLATISVYTTQGLTTVWGVSVAVAAGEDKTSVLNIKALAAVLTMVVTFASARWGDRIGQRRMLIVACVATALGALPLTLLIVSGQLGSFAVAIIIGNGILQGLVYGPIAAYVSELFPAAIRYTGASLAYQTASAVGAGLSPMIASALMLIPGAGPFLIAGFWAVFAVAGALAVWGYRRPRGASGSVAGAAEVAAGADVPTRAAV
ncbi:MAG: MHS family MFS transporter [Arthrobacter sp.]|jgi:MFS family permease|nr:MHS family MFS transporter [Arthrobacter sp.]